MSYTYEQKKRTPAQTDAQSSGGAMDTARRNIPNSMRLAMLESGQAAPLIRVYTLQ